SRNVHLRSNDEKLHAPTLQEASAPSHQKHIKKLSIRGHLALEVASVSDLQSNARYDVGVVGVRVVGVGWGVMCVLLGLGLGRSWQCEFEIMEKLNVQWTCEAQFEPGFEIYQPMMNWDGHGLNSVMEFLSVFENLEGNFVLIGDGLLEMEI
ncbi:hypothetical protein Tco_1187167, partial [Tanacetum coccineum]